MIGSDEVITVPTTVVSSSVTSPTSDIPEQTTADEDSNDETTTNVYGNDTNLIGIQDGHDGTNFSTNIKSHLKFSNYVHTPVYDRYSFGIGIGRYIGIGFGIGRYSFLYR